jgi:LEA14-like dessication related protein
MNRYRDLFLLGLPLLLAAGCVHPVQQLIDEPTVQFVGMSMTEPGVFSATPVFRFELGNTNPMSLDIRTIAYDLTVNGRKFVKGASDQNSRLPAGGRETVSMPISFSFLDLFPAMAEFRDAEAIPYELTGAIGVGPYAVPYSATGRFEVPQLPSVALRSVRLGDVDADLVQLILEMTVENPNPFPIRPRRIDYGVALEGRERSRGSVGELPEVPASDRAGITVSVLVALEGDRELAERLSGGRPVSYRISGDVLFGPPRRGPRGLSFEQSGTMGGGS